MRSRSSLAAVHLAFQYLESVDLALRLPIAPLRTEGLFDGGLISTQSHSEGADLRLATGLRALEPGSQPRTISCAHQRAEVGDELPHFEDDWVLIQECGSVRLLF